MTDIDVLRNATLRLHPLQNTEDSYTIYYDESNNVRKLRLNVGGLNIGKPVCYALAGVFHKGLLKPINLDKFRAAARIAESVEEVKFGTLASGDFWHCMGSQKIENFLDWLRDEGLLIHYQAIDVLYWSIVDIIDSIALPGSASIIGRRMDVDMMVKNALYDVLRADLSATTSLLHEYSYPDVGRTKRGDFLNSLIERVQKDRQLVRGDLRALLLGVLGSARKMPSLPFLEGEAACVLIDSFQDFYLNRIALFPNSLHILDNEAEIEMAITASGLHSAGRPVANYRFADSRAEPGIQAADVVAGIMGKLFDYVIRTTRSQISIDLGSANARQARNITALRMLTDNAVAVSPAFAHAVLSLEDRERASIILD